MSLDAYVFFTPTGDVPPPEWPAITLQEALRLAFRAAYIETPDHVILRRLRGEV